ncbi:hypothetical protein Gorai_003026 [Gossypium raimondii]|uniref:Uncharacterized protein n=1 Tax=Gossypium raimondii TaxID=29730 RepID=A0A7J8QNK8_GOSRA|nr:hypothetical protein [Gossypium raimondii]
MKSSLLFLSENPSLICSVWTRKSYNPNSFRAQMKNSSKFILENTDALLQQGSAVANSKSTESHENDKLECLRIGEFAGY